MFTFLQKKEYERDLMKNAAKNWNWMKQERVSITQILL